VIVAISGLYNGSGWGKGNSSREGEGPRGSRKIGGASLWREGALPSEFPKAFRPGPRSCRADALACALSFRRFSIGSPLRCCGTRSKSPLLVMSLPGDREVAAPWVGLRPCDSAPLLTLTLSRSGGRAPFISPWRRRIAQANPNAWRGTFYRVRLFLQARDLGWGVGAGAHRLLSPLGSKTACLRARIPSILSCGRENITLNHRCWICRISVQNGMMSGLV
jgi:hypothetical protein